MTFPPLIDKRFQEALSGLEVLLNGKPAAIPAELSSQVNFIAHRDIDQEEFATVQLRYTMPGSGEIYLSNTVKMPTAPSWVNAFANACVGAAFHSQGAMSADNPLHENDTLVLFGAGLGRFGNDAIESCDLTSPAEVYRALAEPKVEAVMSDGSQFDAILDFVGPSPGASPTLGQLNMRFSPEFWVFACGRTWSSP